MSEMSSEAAVAALTFAQKAAKAANTAIATDVFVPQMLQLLGKLQLQVVSLRLPRSLDVKLSGRDVSRPYENHTTGDG